MGFEALAINLPVLLVAHKIDKELEESAEAIAKHVVEYLEAMKLRPDQIHG